MSSSGCFYLQPGERFEPFAAPASVILRCAYCGGVPSGAWRSCDYCGAPVRKGQRINVTTVGDTKPRYIEVEE